MDDTHTYYIYYYADWPRDGEDPNQREDEIPVYHVPIAGVDQWGQPIWEQLDNNSGQGPLRMDVPGPAHPPLPGRNWDSRTSASSCSAACSWSRCRSWRTAASR